MYSEIFMKKTMLIIMIIYYYFIIASFSAQPASLSSSESEGVTAFIYDEFISVFDSGNIIGRKNFIETAEHIIRKCAHFGNFFVFSLLISAYVMCFRQKAVVLAMTAFTVSFLFAFFDELHQLFVEGRSCQLSDMLLDSSGAMLGILIYFVLYNIKWRVKD